jgi:hypothetical protein
MNVLHVIHPYKHQGQWVFDDERVGLVREPFVAGADIALERMVQGIPDADRGVTAIFAAQPFPGYQYELQYRRPEHGGAWYYSPQLDMEGWLCSALLLYFPEPPQRIYVQIKPR